MVQKISWRLNSEIWKFDCEIFTQVLYKLYSLYSVDHLIYGPYNMDHIGHFIHTSVEILKSTVHGNGV